MNYELLKIATQEVRENYLRKELGIEKVKNINYLEKQKRNSTCANKLTAI